MQEISGEVLCVSQFTLLANTKKGNKPDFHGALGGEEAKKLYQYFFDRVQQGYSAEKVKNGVFQAMMEVALVNDGPVCLPCSFDSTAFLVRSGLISESPVHPGHLGAHCRLCAAETHKAVHKHK